MTPKEDYQAPPAEAAPIALHLRLRSLEEKVDDLPDAIARRVSGTFVAKTECAHLSGKGILPPPDAGSWLTGRNIFGGLIGLGILIRVVLYGVDSALTQAPVPPAPPPHIAGNK